MTHDSLWRRSLVKFLDIRSESKGITCSFFMSQLNDLVKCWEWAIETGTPSSSVSSNESDHNNNILINPSMTVSAVVSFPSLFSHPEWPTSRRLSLFPCKSLPGLSSWVTLLPPPLESSVLIDVKIILLLTDSMSTAETAQASLVVEEKKVSRAKNCIRWLHRQQTSRYPSSRPQNSFIAEG